MNSLNSSIHSLDLGTDIKSNKNNNYKNKNKSSSSSSSSLSPILYQQLQPQPVHYYYSPEPLSSSYHVLYHYPVLYFPSIPSSPSSSSNSSHIVNNMTSTFSSNILNSNDVFDNDTSNIYQQKQSDYSLSSSSSSSFSSTYTSSIEYYDDSYCLEDQDDDLEIILTDDSSMCSNSMFSANSSNNNSNSNSNNSSCSSSCSNRTTHETIEHHIVNDEDQTNGLQKQLEYYFSRDNLANDIYLVSQMDIDLYVPIVLIANFHRVKQYTNNLNEIIQVLKRSSHVIVDETETKVKPNISPSVERTTVILRELPLETTKKEITEFLCQLNSSPVKNIRYDFGNIWYITFESEKDALKFFHDIRGCLFKEKPVAARMKSVPTIHNLFELLSRLRNQQLHEGLVSKNNHKIKYRNGVNNNESKNVNVNDNNTQTPAKRRRRRRGGKKSKRCREQRRGQQQEQGTASEKPANNKNSVTSITTMDNVNNNSTSTYKQQSNMVTYATIVKRQAMQQQ